MIKILIRLNRLTKYLGIDKYEVGCMEKLIKKTFQSSKIYQYQNLERYN